MSLTQLIKTVIEDKNLREKLLIDPEETCKDFGFVFDPVNTGEFYPDYRATSNILQGGYRP